jgi:hypothetical protein
MRAILATAVFGLFGACATSGTDDSFQLGGIPQPPAQGGKGDSAVSCGGSTCDASLCAWDCSTAGQLCAEACTTDSKSAAYVQAYVNGAASTSFDSRSTPYVPKFSLDNVLIYGCDLWNFADHQGLEIEYDELIHSSFTVDPNDPPRYQRKLDIFVDGLKGPGSYTGAEGSFEMASGSPQYASRTGCRVDVAAQDGGLSGSFSCDLNGASVSGQFSCPGNALGGQIFSAWTPAN